MSTVQLGLMRKHKIINIILPLDDSVHFPLSRIAYSQLCLEAFGKWFPLLKTHFLCIRDLSSSTKKKKTLCLLVCVSSLWVAGVSGPVGSLAGGRCCVALNDISVSSPLFSTLRWSFDRGEKIESLSKPSCVLDLSVANEIKRLEEEMVLRWIDRSHTVVMKHV